MEEGEHLTLEGLHKIVAIRASMNYVLKKSQNLISAFPDVVPVSRPKVKNQKIKDAKWLAGFTSGEGCFLIHLQKSKTKLGETVNLVFKLTQHSRDEQLMRSLINYFHCGQVSLVRTWVDFRVTKFKDIDEIIITFFQKYPIQGVKALDFADWCQVAELINEKKHLTMDGLEKIKKIKDGMNTGRNS